MKIISGTTEFQLNNDTAVVIGKFDGIHKGHQKLIGEILRQKEKGLLACVFSFDPAPAVYFGKSDGKELLDRDEKRELLEQMGVDVLIEFPMNEMTAAMEPEVFAKEVLAGRLRAKFVAAGTDLSFGAGGKGNRILLERMGELYGFGVVTIQKVMDGSKEVSSTYIRELLENGDLAKVRELSGRPYEIRGIVSHGKKLGRTIGMPTANLIPSPHKLLPPPGVYYSTVQYDGKEYRAISNIGYKPTVSDQKLLGIESYLFDFSGQIYGEPIRVILHEFRRPEQRFESLEELKNQLKEDLLAGKDYISS